MVSGDDTPTAEVPRRINRRLSGRRVRATSCPGMSIVVDDVVRLVGMSDLSFPRRDLVIELQSGEIVIYRGATLLAWVDVPAGSTSIPQCHIWRGEE